MKHFGPPKRTVALTTIGVCVVALAACTGGGGGRLDGGGDAPRLAGALTSFDDCDEALGELQKNAKKYADSARYGMTDGGETTMEDGAEAPASGAQKDGGGHSGTNVQEEGIDEPDVVKTDGERIVSVEGDRLHVVDANEQELVGSVEIEGFNEVNAKKQLLFHGDRALVIAPHMSSKVPANWEKDSGTPTTTTLTLVDLSKDDPEVVNDYTVEGSFVDARAIDDMTRIVVNSKPKLDYDGPGLFENEADARKDAIEDSTIEDWLPRFHVNGEDGQVPCRSVARPSQYSGASMLTVLSFDLSEKLDNGKPLSIEADGDTVYGTGDALYIANDRQQFIPQGRGGTNIESDGTELFRFDLDAGATPKFQASGKVPGYLLNQYSMSEHDGHLRVATTERPRSGGGEQTKESSSSVYTLKVKGDDLKEVGHVGGLGEGEQIKSVRFVGDTGYVVTFRQTDPLYTVDLSEPKEPKTTGELKIPGYSAYLHPVSGDRLVGVGKDGDSSGNLTGAQVGLYDVGDMEKPTEVDRYSIDGGSTEVEQDPHAFLYWADRDYVVIPVRDGGQDFSTLVLKVGKDGLSKVGSVEQGNSRSNAAGSRAIVIDNTLWTHTDAGLKASDIDSLEEREWLSYS